MIMTKQKIKEGGSYVAMLCFEVPPTPNEVKTIIEKYYNLPGQILQRTNAHKISIPRHIAIWLILKLKQEQNNEKKLRLSETARNDFPSFDHSSMYHSYYKIEDLLAVNKQIKMQITDIINKIRTRHEIVKNIH